MILGSLLAYRQQMHNITRLCLAESFDVGAPLGRSYPVKT